MPNRSISRQRSAALAALGALMSFGGLAASVAIAASISVKDTAHLHLLKASNSTFSESGQANGDLPGTVEVTLTLTGHTATSSFKIDVHGGGAIWGHGSGKLKLGKGGYESFGGTLIVAGGNGRFLHASGTGGLYGTLNRANDSMNVQVTGNLHI